MTKATRSTAQRREDIGERRRHAQDRRIYRRPSAPPRADDGRSREEIADLPGASTGQVGQWPRIFRDGGPDRLRTPHHQGDPGRLGPAQVDQLKREIAQGVSHDAERVRTRVQDVPGVAHSASGLEDPPRRIGASYHKVSGSFWEADVEEQKRWVRRRRRRERQAGPGTRRPTVDDRRPVRGVEPLHRCWPPVGQGSHVGVGNGRKRLNVLGAYRPDDHDYVGLRLTGGSIAGEQLVKRLEALPAGHPDTAKSILHLGNARCYSEPCVEGRLARHRQSRLVPVPACSPDLDPIERLRRPLRKEAPGRWHAAFEGMRAAAGVLDRLGDHRDESSALMMERFATVEVGQAMA